MGKRRTVVLKWMACWGAGLLGFLAFVPQSGQAAENADAAPSVGLGELLLSQSDASRGAVPGGVQWRVETESHEAGAVRQSTYWVRAKGRNALAECLAPAKNKGESILFNERLLWFYKPGLRKPVSLSARQRLTGQAANGDIAATQYWRDYTVTSISLDSVDSQDAYKLELKAKDQNVTYDRLRYWITKKDHVGIKAEFLTLQGELFKSATFEYGNTLKLNGKTVPFVSKMTIVSTAFPDDVTTLRYVAPVSSDTPDSLFNINNLVR